MLIPDLLEVNEPKYDFPYEDAIRFRIDYDFFLRSIMPKFIVEMHTLINKKYLWRTDCILEHEGAKALVKADEEDRKLYIYVSGSEKKRRLFFAIIRNKFHEINNSFTNLKFDELIPMPDNSEITVPFDHLVYLEEIRKTTFTPYKSRNEYNVKKLLDGYSDDNDRRVEYRKQNKEQSIIVENKIYNPQPDIPKKDETKKGFFQKTWGRIVAFIVFLGVLAGFIFYIINIIEPDSFDSFKKFLASFIFRLFEWL